MREEWQRIAGAQAALISRKQLNRAGVTRDAIRHRLAVGRWLERTTKVISTVTGDLSREQELWRAVLHAGSPCLLSGSAALEVHGLRGWHRPVVEVTVPHGRTVQAIEGATFVRTRRPLDGVQRRMLPVARVEDAALLWASEQPAATREGIIAAAVQQGLTTAEKLLNRLAFLAPLPQSDVIREALVDISGGARSGAELRVRRFCHKFGIQQPHRQRVRRDRRGCIRYTDCEWEVAPGRWLILEIDGAFHMAADHWDSDSARQRSLSSWDRVIVRCSTRELRVNDEVIAQDLIALGVPLASDRCGWV